MADSSSILHVPDLELAKVLLILVHVNGGSSQPVVLVDIGWVVRLRSRARQSVEIALLVAIVDKLFGLAVVVVVEVVVAMDGRGRHYRLGYSRVAVALAPAVGGDTRLLLLLLLLDEANGGGERGRGERRTVGALKDGDR